LDNTKAQSDLFGVREVEFSCI